MLSFFSYFSYDRYLVSILHQSLAPLIVQIGLPIIRVELGHSLTLNCTVSGGPIKAIEWLHNGRSISSSFNSQSVPIGSNSVVSAKNSAIGSDGNYRIRLISREVLHITKVTRADKGMYQCVAYNEVDSAQAQVQLKLGGKCPHRFHSIASHSPIFFLNVCQNSFCI